MRRFFLVLFLLLLLGVWAVSPAVPAAVAAPLPQAVPTADILRGPYAAPLPVVVPIADVLRGNYTAPVPVVVHVSTADVLRGSYAPPVIAHVPTADVLRGSYAPPAAAHVPTADVLRGAYAPAPLFVRGDQPLADVLRQPYAFTPVVVTTTSWPSTAWLLTVLAVLALLIAVTIDLWWHWRGMGSRPLGGGRPLEHPH